MNQISNIFRLIILSCCLFLGICKDTSAQINKSISRPDSVTLELLLHSNCDSMTDVLSKLKKLEKNFEENNEYSLLYQCELGIGHFYIKCEPNSELANYYFANACKVALEICDTGKYYNGILAIYNTYRQSQKIDSTYIYLHKILSLNLNDSQRVNALGCAGDFFFSIGDYRNSLLYFDSTIRVIQSIHFNRKWTLNDTFSYAATLLNIGVIYSRIKDKNASLVKFYTALELGLRTQNTTIQFLSNLEIGKIFYSTNKTDSALVSLLSAYRICKSTLSTEYASETANLLAECYLKKGDLTQAMAYNEESRKLAESRQYTKQLALCDITEGKINTQQKKFVPAVALFKKGLAIATEARDLEIQKSAWEALSDAYTGLDKPALALEAFKNFITLKDSLFSIEKSNELVRMDLEATYSRKQLEDSISHEHKAAAIRLELQKQRVVTYTGFAGIVLVGVLAFFIYRNYNTQKKYNDLLNKEKERHLAHIEAQSHVLSDIAFTQAHEIRGPIATLLGLTQILNTDDPADPENKQILDGIVSVTERLDKTVQEVIGKENQVSAAGKDIGKKS